MIGQARCNISRIALVIVLVGASLGATACGPQDAMAGAQAPDSAADARDARKALRAEGHRKQIFDERRARFQAASRAATLTSASSHPHSPAAGEYP